MSGDRKEPVMVYFPFRVSSDLENLEMSRNFDARRKSQGIFKNREGQGKVREFCCVKFIFSAPRPCLSVFLRKYVITCIYHK